MTQSHVCTPGPWQIHQGQLWGGCTSDPSGRHFVLAILTYPPTNGNGQSTLMRWREYDVQLIVKAANAAMEANPQNPLAAAERLPDMVDVLGQIVAAYDEYVEVSKAPKSLRLAVTKARAVLQQAKRGRN